MRPFAVIVGLFLAGVVVFSAPVPKPSAKPDPGKPWDFPDLDSKGWEKRESGLKVWDVKEGDGDAVTAGATVTVKYTGWLPDGKKFDGGEENSAISFPLRNLIKGWEAGMVGMKPGGIRRVVVPSDLAYGKTGMPGRIPPDSTLVFVIEYVGPGK